MLVILTHIYVLQLQLAIDNKHFTKVRELFLALVKRRGQAKKPVVDMVAMCQGDLFEKMPTRNEKYKMLEALREACEGKMYLEREYAQSTMKLCAYLAEDKKADEATDIIQEIQIETYGSLEVKEKLEFILYQMKLTLARKDFVRMQILSRKLSKRHMNAAGLEEMKIQFQKFMIFYLPLGSSDDSFTLVENNIINQLFLRKCFF